MAGSADSPPSGYLWGMRWTFTECPTDREQKTQGMYKAVRATLLRSTPCAVPLARPVRHCCCPARGHVHIRIKRRSSAAWRGRSCTHWGGCAWIMIPSIMPLMVCMLREAGGGSASAAGRARPACSRWRSQESIPKTRRGEGAPGPRAQPGEFKSPRKKGQPHSFKSPEKDERCAYRM